MRTIKITEQGLKTLQQELQERTNGIRDAILKDLVEARAHGDLSENADYENARERQGQNEARILEINNILKNPTLIKGYSVTISINGSAKRNYIIAGTLEADPLNNIISSECPVGKAILANPKQRVIETKSESGKKLTIEIFS